MTHRHNSGLVLLICSHVFLILHNKKGQEVHENFVRCFLRKNLIWDNLIFSGLFLLLSGHGQNLASLRDP